MKHFLSFCMIFCSLCLLPYAAKSQNTYPVPNGDFEEWSTQDGYSVQIPIQMPWGGTTTVSIPIFSEFLYPSQWSFPSLYVNQTVNIPQAGGDVNINTYIPLIKVGADTLSTSNTALKLQTFKVSDVIVPSTYNFLEPSLGEDLTTMVIPSLMSTGTLYVDQFFFLLSNILNNVDSAENFISSFDGLDLNEYMEGGIALNGFTPGKITGLYKYASATIGDNGAVLMLGSKYDPILHARTVVGGGLCIDLTDAPAYTPFEVFYHSSDEFDSSLDYVEPDTLVILVLSSASNNIQQYSTLCIDNMTIWEADSNDVENTCSRAYIISVSELDTNSATLSWYVLGDTPDHWEAEYGVEGFTQGTGTSTTTTTTELTLSDLQPETFYDVYVRGVCDEGLHSNWSMFRFRTASTNPEDTTGSGIHNMINDGLTIFPNPAHGNCTLRFDEQQPSSIQLYAIDGKLLQTVTPTDRTINLSLPYSGIFMIRCESEKGIIVRKIVNF